MTPQLTPQDTFTVMAWNIWRGGDEAMDAKDPEVKQAKQNSIIQAIKKAKPDVVAMVETYGSGEVISKGLGYHFHPRGTNVSLHSRWPIVRDISVYREFNCVGALIERPDGKRFAVYSVWIHYVDDIWTDPKAMDGRTPADLLAKDGESRAVEIKAILDGIHEQADDLKGVPVILAGDFNSNSHLDYIETAKDQFHGLVVPWPVTKAVADAGFRDSYRVANPKIDRMKDRTWSPRFPDQRQDRIDFIFYKGALKPMESRMLDQQKPHWPSDHSAVVTRFALPTQP